MMPSNARLPSLLLAAALALLAGGCASTTEIVRASVEAQPSKPARTLLVAGVTTDDAVRRRYEEVFVAELARAGLVGVPSTTIIPTLNGLTMPQLHERMQAANGRADAVLHVQLVNLVPAPTLSPQDVPADSAAARRDVGGIAITLNAPAAEARGVQYDIELEANLYALPARTLLWTALTRTREANATDDVARSHARALIDAMRAAGFLAGAPR